VHSPSAFRLLMLGVALVALPDARADAEQPGHATVRIAVAANFRLTLDRLTAAFEAQRPVKIVVSAGASGLLYGQIVQGAPFDLFFSADAARPARLEQDGLIVPGSRFAYAVGRLALWRPGRPWRGSIEAALRAPDVRTVALANPATAPYGQAATQVLERLGVADDAAFRLVRGESIGQTFQFLASGNADLGFVALAQLVEFDALNGRTAQSEAHVVDVTLHEPIVQEAVWLKRSRTNAAAGDFLGFVQNQGRAIIVAAGYAVPTSD